jgi:hypothetical protein
MASDKIGAEELTESVGERWDEAIEDLAEVAVLLLDRAQVAGGVMGQFWRSRPVLASTLLAAAGGALVGVVIGGRAARAKGRSAPQKPVRSSAAAQAAATAREGAERLLHGALGAAGKGPSGTQNGLARWRRPVGRVHVRQARYAADLLPVALAVLKNPLVRRMVWRLALRSFRRRR